MNDTNKCPATRIAAEGRRRATRPQGRLPSLALSLFFASASATQLNAPAAVIVTAFERARVVAIGENHGHAQFHKLLLTILADPRIVRAVDDIAVEWGNARYQPLIDRFTAGEAVPVDSLRLAWRNTVVSPNTVWDSPVYEAFFVAVRDLNAKLSPDDRYRVLLADSPIDWDAVTAREHLAPFGDRAKAMADIIRNESLTRGRRSLFIAGGLHVSRRSRVSPNRLGVPIAEPTPVTWIEFHHPRSTYVIQSLARDEQIVEPALRGAGTPLILTMATEAALAKVPADRMTTMRNRDATRVEVYDGATLGEIVDAVLIWDPADRTFVEAAPATYRDDEYWRELNRRSQLLRGRPMEPSLRDPPSL